MVSERGGETERDWDGGDRKREREKDREGAERDRKT